MMPPDSAIDGDRTGAQEYCFVVADVSQANMYGFSGASDSAIDGGLAGAREYGFVVAAVFQTNMFDFLGAV